MVLAILLTVMAALPLVGLFFFRLYENQLIRQTESELIAQGAVIRGNLRWRNAQRRRQTVRTRRQRRR